MFWSSLMYPCVVYCKVIILCDLCLQYATATLHFVDLERSLKSCLTSQNVVCLLTLFSSEEMALNVFWLIVHVHRNEKRVNDVTQ